MWRRQAAAEAAVSRHAFRVFERSICAAAVLGLAGCTQFSSSALEFTPAALPACEASLIAVHVRWDFHAVTREQVSLYISSPGGTSKLWVTAAPKGETNTGRWMHDGSTVTVRNSKGKLLGIRTLETTSCKNSGSGAA
jgi:hypothetical protein